MNERTAAHGIFSLERTYDASPERVFGAFAKQEEKSRWFAGTEEWTVMDRRLEFRPGGHEHLSGRWKSGTVTRFEAHYFDIVPNRRILYAYDMYVDDRKISVSLATVEFRPNGTGTCLKVTEQGAFLDGYDDGGSRERGTASLLDRLGESLSGR